MSEERFGVFKNSSYLKKAGRLWGHILAFNWPIWDKFGALRLQAFAKNGMFVTLFCPF